MYFFPSGKIPSPNSNEHILSARTGSLLIKGFIIGHVT